MNKHNNKSYLLDQENYLTTMTLIVREFSSVSKTLNQCRVIHLLEDHPFCNKKVAL